MPSLEQIDYAELILTWTRERFVTACRFPFLLGVDLLATPRGPQHTIESSDLELSSGDGKPAELAVLRAVRKVQDAFPAMITVGRTPNNDVVLNDVRLSKFHAFFKLEGYRFELVDAGSRNGTWVGRERLQPNGKACAVHFGDELRFGRLRFHFYEAGHCWDVVRERLAR